MMKKIFIYGITWLLMILPILTLADVAAWQAHITAAEKAATITYDHIEGDGETALMHYKAAIKEAERLGKNDPRLADSLDTLSLCYMHINTIIIDESNIDSELYLQHAVTMIERAKSIREAAFGKNDPRNAESIAMLGHLATHGIDKFGTAEALYNRALTMLKSAKPAYVKTTLKIMGMIGEYYDDDVKKTEQLRRHELDIAEKVYGKDNPRTANQLYRLADAMQDTKTAETLYRRALKNAEKIYGINSPKLADELYHLGDYLISHNQVTKGQACLLQVLTNAEKAYGKNDLRLLPILYRLVNNSWKPRLGNGHGITSSSLDPLPPSPQGERYLLRAVSIVSKNTDKIKEIDAFAQLALFYRSQLKEEAAWRPLEKALDIAEKTYGKSDYRILPQLYALAEWSELEYPAITLPLYARISNIAEKTYGQSLSLIDHLNRLKNAYSRLGMNIEVIKLETQSLNILEKNPDADPDDVVKALLAKVEQVKKNDNLTITAEARVITYITSVYGKNSPELASQLQLFADSARYGMKTRKKCGIDYLKKAQTIIMHCYKANSPELASALANLGDSFSKTSDTDDAIIISLQALAIEDGLKNPDIYLLMQLTDQLGELYQKQNSWLKAETYYLRLLNIYEKHRPTETYEPLKKLLDLYKKQKNWVKAEAIYRKFYANMTGGKYADINESVVNNLIETASVCRYDTRYADAMKWLNQAQQAVEQASAGNYARDTIPAILCEEILILQAWDKKAESQQKLDNLFTMLVSKKDKSVKNASEAIRKLADNYIRNKQYQMANDIVQRQLDQIEKNSNGESNPPVGLLLQLASNYLNLNDNTNAALCYDKALIIEEKNDSGDGPRKGISGYALPAITDFYSKQNRYDVVEGIWRRRLERDKHHSGDEVTTYLESIINLSKALTEQKKYSEAEKELQPILTALQPQEHERQSYSCLILNDVGKLYLTWGKFDIAEQYITRSLQQAEISYSDSYGSKYLLSVLDNYAALLQAQNRKDEASVIETRAKTLRYETEDDK